MSRDVMIGLLRKGKTGSQILEILDAICNNEEPVITKPQPTLEELTFWPFIVTHLETSPIVYPTQSHLTNTQFTESSILRQYNRYMEIDNVVRDTTLWGMITEEMLNRYSNNELKKMGSGQTSKTNMIERRCVEQFNDIYSTDCIDQSVTGKTSERELLIVPNSQVDTVRSYIETLQFWPYRGFTYNPPLL